MTDIKTHLTSLSGYVYERTRRRLEGLDDEEYLWEPAPDCWTVRADASGTHRIDSALAPDPAPFTTIAWRLWHLIGCYGGSRNATWLGLDRPAGGFDHGDPAPGAAAAAIDALERAQVHWHELLASVPLEQYGETIGPIAGQYADSDKAGLVLHQIDEQIHHGAELGVLRDLYRATVAAERQDPDVAALLKGERDGVDRGRIPQLVAVHPDLVLRAARNGQYVAIPVLLDLGFPVDGTTAGDDAADGNGADDKATGDKGRHQTALHVAAGAGHMESVRTLVEAGADLTARDPEYKATPLEWAQYFNRVEAVGYLEEVGR